MMHTFVQLRDGKYRQKFLDHTKQSTTDAIKLSQQVKIRAEATGDLIANKVADKITKILKNPETE